MKPPMLFELDHLFICTSVGAVEGDRLIDFGLSEGSRNMHPGQGTANRRFFFRNSMMELLWLHDEEEARSEDVFPTRLYEGCLYQQTGASPFALCLRPTPEHRANGLDAGEVVPFDCWRYQAPYIPKEVSMYIGANSTTIEEPLLIFSPHSFRPDQLSGDRSQPIDHPLGFREITSVRITTPANRPRSAAFERVCDIVWFSVAPAAEHLLEISFDGATQAGLADFRPGLPLVFRW
jgi:hypothetical protein